MKGILGDLKYALRSFERSPGFYSWVIAMLALGIGACVTVFSLVDGVLLRPLPYPEPQQLVTLTSVATRPPFRSNGSISYADYRHLRAGAKSFSGMAITFRTGWSRVKLTGTSEPAYLQGAFVSPSLFSMFGRAPRLGRTFTEEENRLAERVVVLSESFWRERFGSARDVVGKDLELSGVKWRVIGVMPGNFRVPFLDTALWAPLLSHPEWNDRTEGDPLQRQRWDVIARLKTTASISAAQAEVSAIYKPLRMARPDDHVDDLRIVPLRQHFSGELQKPLWILFGSVAFLLLIACANATNLLFARSAQRARELAVRSALGAGAGRLLRQALIEAVLLSTIAGLAGIAISFWVMPLLRSFAPADTPLLADVAVNSRSLLFALAASGIAGILAGILPAWRSARQAASETLKSADRSSTESRGARRLKASLVTAEFTLAMILLTGAGLLIRSFIAIVHVNLGFEPTHLIDVRLGVPSAQSRPQALAMYAEIMQRIRRLPGVQTVGGAGNVFFLNDKEGHALRLVEGKPPEPKAAWKTLTWTQVSGDYFRAMGIPLLRGRYLDEQDRAGRPLTVVINETLAHRYWPGEDPIGKRVKGFDARGLHDEWLTVVGLVRDMRSGGMERAPFSQIYESLLQTDESLNDLVVRTAGDPPSLASAMRRIIHQVDPAMPVVSIAPMEQMLAAQETQRRFETWLLSLFSAIALSLAALGIFAIMHYSVLSETRALGIRMALGATAYDIFSAVIFRGLLLAITGIAIGMIVALWSNAAIAGMLYGVDAVDSGSFAMAALVLIAVALIGCYAPAHRAARLDPIAAIREQ